MDEFTAFPKIPCRPGFQLQSGICWRKGSFGDMVAPFGTVGRSSGSSRLGYSSFFVEVVRRQCGEPPIFNRAAHREVVEALPLA